MLNVLGHVYIHYCLRGAAVLIVRNDGNLVFPRAERKSLRKLVAPLDIFFLAVYPDLYLIHSGRRIARGFHQQRRSHGRAVFDPANLSRETR